MKAARLSFVYNEKQELKTVQLELWGTTLSLLWGLEIEWPPEEQHYSKVEPYWKKCVIEDGF